MKAKFITIEGVEGVGKSTVVKHIATWLSETQIPHFVTREPGGTEIAEMIRNVLLQHCAEEMNPDTELLLMFAARAQHLSCVIRPHLAQGNHVICDRFTDASYAYQGGGRGIPEEKIKMLEQFVHPNERPDLTLLLVAPIEVALQRARTRKGSADRFEKETVTFFERVQNAYIARAQKEPERFRLIDSSGSEAEIFQAIQSILNEILLF
jgi:dTMP kinase